MTMQDIFPETFTVIVDSQPLSESGHVNYYSLHDAIKTANQYASVAECHSVVMSWEEVPVYEALIGAGERINHYERLTRVANQSVSV